MATRHDFERFKTKLTTAAVWCRVTGVVFAPAVAATTWLAVGLADMDDWRSNKLCEAQEMCLDPELASECDALSQAVKLLFGMYTAAMPSVGGKLCLMTVFWLAHISKHEHWTEALKTSLRSRVVASLAFWGTMLILGVPALIATVYRYGILTPTSSSYAEIVYPSGNTSDMPSAIVAASALALGLTVEIYMLQRRAKELKIIDV